MAEITDRLTTYVRDGPERTAWNAEFKAENWMPFQRWVQVLPLFGGTVTVPPGMCAVFTLPGGRRRVFAEGMHWLGQILPWGVYPAQFVDVMQHRTPVPLTDVLCQDGWHVGIALDICWRVRDASYIVDIANPVGDLVTAARASIRAVVEAVPHSAFIGGGSQNGLSSDVLVHHIAARLRSDPAIQGVEVLRVLVTDWRVDERCLEINQEAMVEQTRAIAETALVSHQKALESVRQSLVLLEAETERMRVEEEHKVRIREAELEAEARGLLMPSKREEAQLELMVDTHRQYHEQRLKLMEAYAQVLSEAARLGQLEAVGISSRRRPEFGGGGLEDALKQGLSNLQNVLQVPTLPPGSEQATQAGERIPLGVRVAAEVAEIACLDGVEGCNIEIDSKEGICRVRVRFQDRAIDIVCHPEYPDTAPEVRWSDNGREQVEIPWSREMSLQDILQEVQATAEQYPGD